MKNLHLGVFAFMTVALFGPIYSLAIVGDQMRMRMDDPSHEPTIMLGRHVLAWALSAVTWCGIARIAGWL